MTILRNAIEDLLNSAQLTVDEAADRHFAPGFRQRTNGRWDDRATFVSRIASLRAVVEHASIDVLEEFVHGDRYAERHVIDLTTHEGERIVQEVYVFAARNADGRFTRIEETTLLLDP